MAREAGSGQYRETNISGAGQKEDGWRKAGKYIDIQDRQRRPLTPDTRWPPNIDRVSLLIKISRD